MGIAGEFAPEKLVIGVLTSRLERRLEIVAACVERWGPADSVSEPFPFTFTAYYDEEMGIPISRFFVTFERLVDPSLLARIKLATNAIEDIFRERGARKVNLDPGLLALSRFVLATTKENAHRIPLDHGIYAEITLRFERGAFQPMPWTYPDYRAEPTLGILTEARARYKAGLHAAAEHPAAQRPGAGPSSG
jgi:hypothetical protein